MREDVRQPVVLVAEDREDDALMLRRAFRQPGLNTPVQYVADGEQAIAYLAGRGATSILCRICCCWT